MLFAMTYTARQVTEENEKRSLSLFTHWQPPAGYEFKSHYAFADGPGCMGIIEASSAAAILEAHSPVGPLFRIQDRTDRGNRESRSRLSARSVVARVD